jgi:asparagine synthase (glutamine-hydrolysing)
MCGIAGIIDPSIKSEDLRNQVVEMLTKTIHRGPDNMGSWVNCQASLGHNRLKVIDLSDNANQPFEYGDFIITFNGEIYNFLELREVLKSKGHVFDTKSDTEVVVASFKEWGINCVEHFVGMWAFALWDVRETGSV